MQEFHTDALVIGSGISGLSFALKLATLRPELTVTIASKASLEECNTFYAQGGIAAVMNPAHDSYDQHIADTIAAGDGLCNPDIVNMVVKKGPLRIRELLELGVDFDFNVDKKLSLGMEGGHSAKRIVRSKDRSGQVVELSLLGSIYKKENIRLLPHHFATDLMQDNCRKCVGATLIDANGTNLRFYAQQTIIATGGLGHVYETTTNPTVATGDGIAMAILVGAKIENMAFIQFHPTALYETSVEHRFLISEALRGAGAILTDKEGKPFMPSYDDRGSLATRDVVSRAVFTEMQKFGQEHVYLDLRHLNKLSIEMEFPTIFKKCAELKLDLQQDLIPVVPAAHYSCGGVKTDSMGRTSIEGLICLGEAACTGMHGANRLASNSLLEALVFAHRAAIFSVRTLNSTYRLDYPDTQQNIFRKTRTQLTQYESAEIKLNLQKLMTKNVGIISKREELQETLNQIDAWLTDLNQAVSIPEYTLRNLLLVAKAITQDSLLQKQNKGCLMVVD